MRISIWKYFAISFVCLLFIFYLFIYLLLLFIYLFFLTRVLSQIAKYASFIFDLGSTGGAVMRALASHRCGPGWIPRPGVTWVELVDWFSSLFRGFFSEFSIFPPSLFLNIHQHSEISNHVWSCLGISSLIIWLALPARKMKQILCSDTRAAYLARAVPALFPQKRSSLV